MTHRDGFPRRAARSAGRSDAGHRKPCATQSESPSLQDLGKPPPVAQANRRRASASLDDVPHRRRLPSYLPVGPTHRLHDLYGSLSALLGISFPACPETSAPPGSPAQAVPTAIAQGYRVVVHPFFRLYAKAPSNVLFFYARLRCHGRMDRDLENVVRRARSPRREE